MSNLTDDQLEEITNLINARRAEFGPQMFDDLSAGEVRLAADVVLDWYSNWQDEQERERTKAELERICDEFRAMDRRDLAMIAARHPMRVPVPVPDDDPPEPPPVPYADQAPKLNSNGRHVAATSVAEPPADVTPKLAEKSTEPDAAPEPDAAHARLHEVLSQTHDAEFVPAPTAPAVPRRDPRVPHPDTARERLATALAASSKGDGLRSAIGNQGRTLADADADARKPPSAARIRQLEELKQKRRAGKDRAERERRQRAAADVTYDQFVAEVKRISMGGHMPTQTQFNMSKPAVWPTATVLLTKFSTSWEAVAEACGLAWSHGRKNVPSAA